MPIADMLVLGLIVVAFVAFAATLAWVSRHDGAPRAQRGAPERQPRSFTERHA